ncbi:GIY-YIG nuclease family protein [Falsiruegeria mediterranea]
MAVRAKPRRRIKKSGIIYFAINNRISEIVKIGMTTDSAESRLKTANRKHEFMCGKWTINQKVKTNDVKRTEELAHTIFSEFHDMESVSSEMYFIPHGMTVKNMADLVREKDKVAVTQASKRQQAQEKIAKAQAELERINKETAEMITLPNNGEKVSDDE